MAYDADCGPCTRFKEAIDFFDAYHRIDFMPLDEADEVGLLEKVSPARRYRSMHLLSPDGDVWSGANALPTLISLLPAGFVLSEVITSVPGVMPVTRFVYSTFARLHDIGSCRYTHVAYKASSVPV